MNEKRMESFLRGPVSNSIPIEEVKGHFWQLISPNCAIINQIFFQIRHPYVRPMLFPKKKFEKVNYSDF
jgi:hypothetical protein